MRNLFAEICRFLLAGSANTLLTMTVFQALVTLVTRPVAYSIAWFGGLLFVAIIYPTSVFRVKRSWIGGSALGLVYAIVFVLGFLFIKLLGALQVNPRLGIFIVLIVTTGMNYLGSRLASRVMRRRFWNAHLSRNAELARFLSGRIT